MTIYIITGHLGSGKTMGAVAQAKGYLERGRPVASNMTLNLQALLGSRNKHTYTKLPAIPRYQDLQLIGKAYDGPYDESRNGFVLLDEAGTWLNSRDWSEKGRRELFQWVTHARKYGWDVGLIIQDYESLDAQIRRSVSERIVKWIHFNHLIPFIGGLLPRIHCGVQRYYKPDGPVIKRTFQWGKALFAAYDTTEAVKEEINITEAGEIIDARGAWTGLSNWHTQGRYLPPTASMDLWVNYLTKWLVVGPLLLLVGQRAALVDAWKLDTSRLMPGMYPELAASEQKKRAEIEKDKVRQLAAKRQAAQQRLMRAVQYCG